MHVYTMPSSEDRQAAQCCPWGQPESGQSSFASFDFLEEQLGVASMNDATTTIRAVMFRGRLMADAHLSGSMATHSRLSRKVSSLTDPRIR
jgi:hypothetical protein